MDSTTPIVRPRSQFNIFPAASPPPYTATDEAPSPPSPARNFSHPVQKPMADIHSRTSALPSNRQSTYSAQPNIFGTRSPQPTNLQRSDSTQSRQTLSSEASQNEIRRIEEGLDKLENKKLGQQRYVPSARKEEGMQAFALGAKLERALGRRLGGQDAVMRVRNRGEGMEKGSIAA